MFQRTPLLALLLLALPCIGLAAPAITSPDFTQGGMIPSRFTCEGRNVSPALEIAGIPAKAASLALVVDDPDAPGGTFTHWIVWNIPPGTRKFAGGAAPGGAVQGTNDFGNAGYSGPCPPSGIHRYFFRLFALDAALHLTPGASRKEFDAALAGHVVAQAVLMGRYEKGGSQ
jgi:Raf kinase inhibitor-like YbhB/YbcL family protein